MTREGNVNICLWCGAALAGKRLQARYCSPSHRILACRQRKSVHAHAGTAAALPSTGGGDNHGPGDTLTAAAQAARHTGHFRAVCAIYPHFSFNVPALRALRQTQGEEFPSGVVHFHHGLLDTRAQGFTEAEADAMRTHLETRRSRPEWGVDIIVVSPLGR